MKDNRKILLWLLPLIGLLAVSVMWQRFEEKRNWDTFNVVSNVGLDLVREGKSDRIVHMDSASKEKVGEVRRMNPIVRVLPDDAEKPIGDGRADACLIFSSGERDLLGLRISIEKDGCHILGYWTPPITTDQDGALGAANVP